MREDVFLRFCFNNSRVDDVDQGAAPVDEGDIETNWDEVVETFDAMELREDLLRGIFAYGFEKPSAIQQVINECCCIWCVEHLIACGKTYFDEL